MRKGTFLQRFLRVAKVQQFVLQKGMALIGSFR
jgi:hypothetical protein